MTEATYWWEEATKFKQQAQATEEHAERESFSNWPKCVWKLPRPSKNASAAAERPAVRCNSISNARG